MYNINTQKLKDRLFEEARKTISYIKGTPIRLLAYFLAEKYIEGRGI